MEVGEEAKTNSQPNLNTVEICFGLLKRKLETHSKSIEYLGLNEERSSMFWNSVSTQCDLRVPLQNLHQCEQEDENCEERRWGNY